MYIYMSRGDYLLQLCPKQYRERLYFIMNIDDPHLDPPNQARVPGRTEM